MKGLVVPFLICLFACPVFGQSGSAYVFSGPLPEGLQQSYSRHHLFNGREFVPHNLSAVGSPNHADLVILDHCSVVFDGVFYDDIPLLYDLVIDQLVTIHPDRKVEIYLEKHLVDWFSIQGDQFVRIAEDQSELPSGFYQLVYQGDTYTCYAKRSKEARRYSSGTTLEYRFFETVTYYLQVGDDPFRTIKSQKELLSLDDEHRRAIRRMLRSSGLSFRARPVETLNAVLAFLDHNN